MKNWLLAAAGAAGKLRMKSGMASALAGAALALTAAQANAAIVNIDAVTNSGLTPVTYTFTPGTYRIEWIGTADGGAYDAYKLGETAPWRNDFFGVSEPGPHPDIDQHGLFEAGGAKTFASADDALSAYRSAPTILNVILAWNGVAYVFDGFETIPQPWIAHADDGGVDGAGTVKLWIADAGDRSDNVGGVSLRITAVPEPSTWALMIVGFGGAGAALRQRRSLAAAVPGA